MIHTLWKCHRHPQISSLLKLLFQPCHSASSQSVITFPAQRPLSLRLEVMAA